MYRIILLVLRLLWKVPYYIVQLIKYQKVDKYSEEERYGFIRRLLIDVTRAGRIDVVYSGLENLPEENGYLMAPNHQGLFDPVIIAVTHVRPTTAVIKKELQSVPVVKQIAVIAQAQAMDRENIRASMKVIKQVTKELKEGRNYIIFPEGTRSRQGNIMGEFKGGTFKSVVEAEKPIVPVACIDCYKPFDTKSIKRVTSQVHYLKPIYPSEYKGMSTVEIAQLVQSRIQDKMNEILQNKE